MNFRALFGGFITGIGLGEVIACFSPGLGFILVCLLGGLSFLVGRLKKIFLFLLSVIWGISYYHLLIIDSSAPKINSYINQKINFTAVIISESDKRLSNQKLVAQINEDKILITTDLYPDYRVGDLISGIGRLEAPKIIDRFDYQAYLARFNIYALMPYPQIEIIGQSHDWLLVGNRKLLELKSGAADIISRGLKEPLAGLAQALILGYKHTLSPDYLEKFSILGLSHVIAISGTHITLLAAILMWVLKLFRVGGRWSLWIIAGILIIYIILTGSQASAVRSGIMGIFSLWALNYQKKFTPLNILLFTATLMLFFNPRLLRADLGFQLSFLAMIALIEVCPVFDVYIKKILSRVKNNFWTGQGKIILDILNLTVCSQLLTAPVLVINFARLSLISPLANVLVLWVFGPLMIFLLLALILAVIFPFGIWLWFWPSYLLGKYMLVMTNWLASWPLAAINIAGMTWWGGAVYYFLGWLIFCYLKNRSAKTCFLNPK